MPKKAEKGNRDWRVALGKFEKLNKLWTEQSEASAALEGAEASVATEELISSSQAEASGSSSPMGAPCAATATAAGGEHAGRGASRDAAPAPDEEPRDVRGVIARLDVPAHPRAHHLEQQHRRLHPRKERSGTA